MTREVGKAHDSVGGLVNNNEAGSALENAVWAVEQLVVATEPQLRGAQFTLRTRHIVVVDGVRHEIDLHVEALRGAGYDTTFIFECKNWKDPVGKNEIIVFAEKIAVACAQRGFFVAPAFTKDAVAQAAKCPRMELVTAARFTADIEQIGFFHYFFEDPPVVDLFFWPIGQVDDEVRPVDLRSADIRRGGRPATLDELVQPHLPEMKKRPSAEFPSGDLPQGTYELRSRSATLTFAPGDLSINAVQVGGLTIEARWQVHIVRPEIVAGFDIDGRGRAIVLGPAGQGDRFVGQTILTSRSRPRASE